MHRVAQHSKLDNFYQLNKSKYTNRILVAHSKKTYYSSKKLGVKVYAYNSKSCFARSESLILSSPINILWK